MIEAREGEVLAPESKYQIAEYSETAAALASLRQRFGSVVYDVTDKRQLAAAKEARAEIRGYRTALEKKRVEIKAPALERCRLIDAEAKAITAELVSLESPIDDTIKAEERRAAAAEEERVSALRARVDRFTVLPLGLVGKPADTIAQALDALRDTPVVPDEYQEFAEAAHMARESAVTALSRMLEGAKAAEEAAARLKAEREDLDRRQAEQRQREAEEEARRREAREREEAEFAERRKAIEAEERRQAEHRRQDEERDRVHRLAIEQQEREARAKAEQEALDKRCAEERERYAKETAEREARREEMVRADARTLLTQFSAQYGNRAEFAGIIKAIAAYFKKVTK